MRATSVRRCQPVPIPAPPSSTRDPGETARPTLTLIQAVSIHPPMLRWPGETGRPTVRGRGGSVVTLVIAVILSN